MKIKTDNIRVMLFALFGLILTYVVYSALNRLSVSRHDSYNVKALFHDLKQLQIGDDVRVAGVRVGSVINTYLNKDLAVAVLNIEKKYEIPENSVATILMAGLLGANYISIVPGNSTKNLTEASYIETQAAIDISSVIQKFSSVGDRLDRVLSSFEGGDSENSGSILGGGPGLFKEIGDFFHNNKDKLNQIVDNVANVTGKISNGEGTLGKLVCEDKAYEEFTGMIQSIRTAADKVDSMLKTFDDISKSIKNGDGLLAKLISDPETARSFDEIVKNVQEFSRKLNSDDSTLGRILTNDDLYKKAESTLGKVEKAVDTVSDSGPVTAVGVAASALF